IATAAAGGTFALLGAFLTFPVWTIARGTLFSDSYFKRTRYDIWFHSADLWQYFWPANSRLGGKYFGDLDAVGIRFGEHGSFLGFLVLIAIALYVPARLRGRQVVVVGPRLLDRMMGLIVVFVLLSLR